MKIAFQIWKRASLKARMTFVGVRTVGCMVWPVNSVGMASSVASPAWLTWPTSKWTFGSITWNIRITSP